MNLAPAFVRAKGEIRATFALTGGRTQVDRAFETGGLRLRFPNGRDGCEAVVVNTAGGVAGGDSALCDFVAEEGADVLLTTQSAEKIYRAQRDPAEINLSLRARDGASIAWLPQETILFSGAKLRRRLDADVGAGASLTILEAVVFGRVAMGELVVEGALHDRWRVRREGRLVFAEDFRVEGDIAGLLERPAIGRKARASAVLLHVSPRAESLLESMRGALGGAPCEWGASAWNGMLVVRFVSPSPELQRIAIISALRALRGAEAPRVWQ